MTVAVADELGGTIRERRKHLGLSQHDLATFAGVSLRVLSSLERGKPTARLDIIVAVLDALGLELTVTRRSPA